MAQQQDQYRPNLPLNNKNQVGLNQSLNQTSGVQNLNEKYNPQPNSSTRRSPSAGGPQRISDQNSPNTSSFLPFQMPKGRKRIQDAVTNKIKRSVLGKAAPYFIASGSTGLGLWWGIDQFI